MTGRRVGLLPPVSSAIGRQLPTTSSNIPSVTSELPDDRRRAAVQASLNALLSGASMIEAMAAADAMIADGELADASR